MLILSVACIASCGGDNPTSQVVEEKTDSSIYLEQKMKIDSVTSEELILPLGFVDVESLKPLVNSLLNIYGDVPYCFVKDSVNYFFVTKSIQKQYVNEGNWLHNDNNLGIVNGNGEVILPLEYSKIYNPDFLAEYWVEVKKGEKLGLVNYVTKQIIDCQFDFLFPSQKDKSILFGSKAGKLFSVNLNNLSIEKSDLNWLECLKIKESDLKKALAPPLLSVKGSDILMFTPSYLEQFHFMNEVFANYYSLDIDEVYIRNLVVEDVNHHENGVISILTSFFEEGVSGRGYQIENKNLLTSNQKNTFSDQSFLFQRAEDMNIAQVKGFKEDAYFLNDSMVRVKRVAYQELLEMDVMSKDYLYVIGKNGKIKPLENYRVFDFTKHVEIDDSYLKGCYMKHLNVHDYDEPNLLIWEFLDEEALDLMRNEIFAEYGLKFKTEKWQKYFEAQIWYSPIYDDVSDLLSEIDKKNIQFILNAKERIKNDKSILNKKETHFWAAG